MKTMETVEPGIYRRVDPRSGKVLPKLWVHYPGPTGTVREPTHTTSIVAARKLRAKRLEQHGRGEPGRAAEQVRVAALLDALVTHYTLTGKDLPTLHSQLKALRPAFGHLRAIDCTTTVIAERQLAWQQASRANATINRLCNSLRRGFTLACQAGTIHVAPHVPRLDEGEVKGHHFTSTDAETLAAQLPAYLQNFVLFAMEYGIRKSQLARTQRRFVDLDRGAIAWPKAECKAREAHTVPLEGAGLAIVQRLMARPPLHCPYLFHGPRCAPGHTPSKKYGCLGDFKKAWATACRAAGFPAGRKAGGFVFHDTRRTAATNLRAGGMDEADAMKITGHQTAHVFRRYDLGEVDALRQRLSRARTKAAIVTQLRGSAKQHATQGTAADSCTAAAQHALAGASDVE